MKKSCIVKISILFVFSTFIITFSGCEKEKQQGDLLNTYDEKNEFISSTRETLVQYLETMSFSDAVKLKLEEINNHPEISKAGMVEDTMAIWWETMDSELFVIWMKNYDLFIDSLDNDETKSEIIFKNNFTNENLPQNNKAILLSPYYYHWSILPPSQRNKDINYFLKTKLEERGYEVSYLKNENKNQQNISLQHYKNWHEYGVISYSGHSGIANNVFVLRTGILNSKSFREENLSGFEKLHFYWDSNIDDPQIRYGITHFFFRDNYPNKLNNSFILISSCHSQSPLITNEIVPSDGSSVYWGWSDLMQPLAGAWRNTRYMINQYMDFGKTSDQVYNLMVENNRHRNLLFPHMKYTYLSMASNSNPDFILIEQEDQAFENFNITAEIQEYNSDWDNIVQNEFGSDFRVADWNDLVNFYNSGGDLLALFDQLGLTEYGNSTWLYRNGQQFYSSTRAYLTSRHEHNRPSNYLAHDNINNYLISLGSWYNPRKIMVIKK